jgi:hypothetical protein
VVDLLPFWILPPQTLDEKGRCCGRKPLPYKRDGLRACLRCSRHYHLTENRMVDGWRFLANGNLRLSHPQGGGESYHQDGRCFYFFFPGALPIGVSTLLSSTSTHAGWWDEAAMVVFTMDGMGRRVHIGQASIKFNRRIRL